MNLVKNISKIKSLIWYHSCSNFSPLNGSAVEFYFLLWTADHHPFFGNGKRNKISSFQLHILKQFQTQSPLARCHISTFTLTIPVSRLQHNSLRCPFATPSTQISLQLQFFSTHIHSAVYSSLFSKLLEIQTTLNGPIVNLEWLSVLTCSSNNCNVL